MDLILKGIDKYEEFCETILIPIAKTGKTLISENKYLNSVSKLRNEFMQNKINLFFQHLNLKREEQKLNFINNLNNNEKIFFIETINKIIDLDDNLQNYILSCLVEEYNKNGELNYFEKKLYYNINNLSEDDFHIFYCMYYESIIKNKTNYIHIDTFEKKEIIKISFDRLANLGLLILTRNITSENKASHENIIHENIYYKESEYSSKLYKYLEVYLKDFSCEDIIKKKVNTISDGKIKFY